MQSGVSRITPVSALADKSSSVRRELPGNYPFSVTKDLIVSFVRLWQQPMNAYFTSVYRLLASYAKRVVAAHFGQHVQSGLCAKAMFAAVCG